MLPNPVIGQLVRLESHDERFAIKSAGDDGWKANLVSETDPSYEISDVPCLDLFLARRLFCRLLTGRELDIGAASDLCFDLVC